jgi:hypothetical protein
MRANTKLVSFLLCAVFLAAFTATASAAVTYNVSSNPNEVTQYGVTEVMGRVRLEATTSASTVGSTITITYQGVTIKNTVATGITVTGTGAFAAPGVVTVSQVIPTTGTGGQIVLSIADAIATTGTANTDLITIDGVRADVSTKAVGTDIQASLSSTPSTANTFSNVSVVRVATINQSLILATDDASDAICIDPVNPTVTVTEGFAGAFVQYVTSAAGAVPSANSVSSARAKYGANRNIRLHLVLTGLPAGVTLTWPTATTDIDGGGAGTDTSSLELISQSTSGDDALYEFVTANQGSSDANVETFSIVPVVAVDQDTAVPGVVTVKARLEPQDTSTATVTSTDIPRFNHPYINDPEDVLLTESKCTTNLLFPFLTNAANSGFDSGIAVSNTSKDPFETVEQTGTVTVYFYGTAAPASPLTTPSVAAGETWAASLSTIAPGFQGYAIAICQFQYGHGFAFIVGKYNSDSVYDVAEGYIANVIPDPSFNSNSRRAAMPVSGQQSGENLGN